MPDSPTTPSPPTRPDSSRPSTPQGVKWLSPGLENLDELQGLLRPAKKGMLEHYRVGEDVGKVTNDGDYPLSLNIE